MKQVNMLWIALLVALVLLPAYGEVQAKEKPVKDDKVAMVNGSAITKAQLDTEMGRYEQQMSMSGRTMNPEQQSGLKKMILENLVNRELLSQESAKSGIKVSDAEVNDQIAALKQKFPSANQFNDTLGQLKLTEADLKNQLNRDLAIKKLIDKEVANKITISQDEAKSFYDSHPDLFNTPEQVRASHILIKVDSKASPEEKNKAHQKMEEIQKKIKNGEDFASLAKQYSGCPSSANGGDLDFFEKGQMVAPFEKAAFALKKGEVSDIVETEFGYHIIKVTDRKDAGVMPFEQMKDKIEQRLKQEKVNQQMSQYIDQLKTKSKIETFTE